ncbi:MAG: hypothetical protein CMM94_07730 [Rickettsiales bacterium]|nr:hypothetical protein [Rickettsiales bacterium]
MPKDQLESDIEESRSDGPTDEERAAEELPEELGEAGRADDVALDGGLDAAGGAGNFADRVGRSGIAPDAILGTIGSGRQIG